MGTEALLKCQSKYLIQKFYFFHVFQLDADSCWSDSCNISEFMNNADEPTMEESDAVCVDKSIHFKDYDEAAVIDSENEQRNSSGPVPGIAPEFCLIQRVFLIELYDMNEDLLKGSVLTYQLKQRIFKKNERIAAELRNSEAAALKKKKIRARLLTFSS